MNESKEPVIELYQINIFYEILEKIHQKISAETAIKTKPNKSHTAKWLIELMGGSSDGLLIIPNKSKLEVFYQHFQNIKLDQWQISKLVSDSLEKFLNFSESNISKLQYQFNDYTFIIDKPSVLSLKLTHIEDKIDRFYIGQKLYEKIKKQYNGPETEFADHLLCIVLRYKLIDLGITKYSIDPNYKEKLKEYGFDTECHGTPFNAYYNKYYGVWYDINKYFGSQGLVPDDLTSSGYFFNLTNNTYLLKSLYDRITKSLQSSEPTVCILNIPLSKDSKSLIANITNDKLYVIRKIKYEYLIDPWDEKDKLQPPYVSFLFYNQSYSKKLSTKITSLHQLFETFENYHLEMPVRNQIYDNKYKIELFKKLLKEDLSYKKTSIKNTHLSVKLNQIDYTYGGEYHYLSYDDSKWMVYLLSDLFNDHCRIKCTFANVEAPVDYFRKNKDKLIEKILDKDLEVNPINLREEVYQNTIECSTHNPLIIKKMISIFGAKKVLDPSSGWGDRLIGAMTSPIDMYLGVDPNECLHPGYQEIINLFRELKPNPKATYIEVMSPFEKYSIPPEYKFDLIYTSPPYFDYENYTQLKTQSMRQHTTEDKWYTDFLLVSVNKCIGVLNNGGHLALYISQERGKTYVERLIKYMKGLPNIYYLGNIFYGKSNMKQLHPIFIFQKNDEIPVSLYNPPLTIRPVKHNGVTIHVIRDDLLVGGSKIRASVTYFSALLQTNPKLNEIIFIGAQNGYGQLALAYTLYLMKRPDIRLILYYISRSNEDATKIKILVKHYHSNTSIEHTNDNVYEVTDAYLKSHPNAVKLGFGLQSEDFMKIYYSNVKDHFQPYVNKIKRLWIVGGSATLFNIYFKLLPNTFFNLVQVGKKVELNEEHLKRTKLYVSSYKLSDQIKYKIPYPTTVSYDGKIWEFANEFLDGDYIWNVAGIHMII